MSEYILIKYATTLNAQDMLYLFSKVIEKHGNISKAAQAIGISRRSYYTLKDRAFLHPDTKEKILSTAYNLYPDETLDYVLKRQVDDSLEVLSTNLSKLYEEAIRESDRTDLRVILEHFDKVKQEYEGLILDNIQQEVLDQITHLREKAEVSEVIWRPTQSTLFKIDELMIIISLINKELEAKSQSEVISEKYGISHDLVKTINRVRNKDMSPLFDEYAGYIYGKVPSSDTYDPWINQHVTAAGTELPTAVIYGARPEVSASTASTTPYTPGKDRI